MKRSFISLSDFLTAAGVDDSTPQAVINELKAEHRRLYLKDYNAGRKEKYRRLTVRLTRAEHEELKTYQQAYDSQSLANLLKTATFSVVRDTYLQKSPQEVVKLRQAINKIGSTINQLVYKAHIHHDTGSLERYRHLREQVLTLSEEVKTFFASPIPSPVFTDATPTPDELKSALHAYINTHPDHHKYLVTFVQKLKPKQLPQQEA